MSEHLSEYTVLIGGIDHTMQLSDTDAERLGAKKAERDDVKAASAQNKARTALDK